MLSRSCPDTEQDFSCGMNLMSDAGIIFFCFALSSLHVQLPTMKSLKSSCIISQIGVRCGCKWTNRCTARRANVLLHMWQLDLTCVPFFIIITVAQKAHIGSLRAGGGRDACDCLKCISYLFCFLISRIPLNNLIIYSL